jgi:hypothetical protein
MYLQDDSDRYRADGAVAHSHAIECGSDEDYYDGEQYDGADHGLLPVGVGLLTSSGEILPA